MNNGARAYRFEPFAALVVVTVIPGFELYRLEAEYHNTTNGRATTRQYVSWTELLADLVDIDANAAHLSIAVSVQ
jgi:hypothetical protein